MKIAVDTNILVRFLTRDNDAQARAAAAVIAGADTVYISIVVFCELAWVLRRAYGFSAAEIGAVYRGLIETSNVVLDRPSVEAGLAMLQAGGDFADGVTRFEAEHAGCDRLVTLDRAFAGRSDPAKVHLPSP